MRFKRPLSGPCFRGDRGFSILWVLAAVGALLGAAMVLAPDMVRAKARGKAENENQTLQRIGDALHQHVIRNQSIPGIATWVRDVSRQSGASSNELLHVFPQLPSVATRRVYWIDPGFTPATGPTILPYVQPATGLDPLLGQVPGLRSRVMVVSSSLRTLTLPLPSGILPQALFDQLWDWAPSPTGMCPLDTLDTAWADRGDALQIHRVDLHSLFHRITFRRAGFAVSGRTPAWATNFAVERWFLKGSPLELRSLTNAAVVARRVVTRDEAIDLSSVAHPIAWWTFDSGLASLVAVNQGRLGEAAAATVRNSLGLTLPGPRPPAQPAYASLNEAVPLDGIDDFLETSQSLLNGLRSFSIACWIRPNSLTSPSREAFCGQLGVAALGLEAGQISLRTPAGGNLSASYPHPALEWHHVTATADGSELRLYLDGALFATGGHTPAGGNYGSSSEPFRIGGGNVFDGTGNYFQGSLDEVMVFQVALTGQQAGNLALNSIPD